MSVNSGGDLDWTILTRGQSGTDHWYALGWYSISATTAVIARPGPRQLSRHHPRLKPRTEGAPPQRHPGRAKRNTADHIRDHPRNPLRPFRVDVDLMWIIAYRYGYGLAAGCKAVARA
ncbi:hypothetical protein [Gordonia sp. DT101]|uniref:hypothetical protein n=1 Tax=Gordonia sp. DT101 TaxID=3416545 RepID=UPI003CE908E4